MVEASEIRIDTHFHAFTTDAPMVSGRRYTPDAEAPLDAYFSLLDNAGISGGVIIQPSFLGTDNSFLVACLEQSAGRLRGIAVVDPGFSMGDLQDLDSAGVDGIRLNLIGIDAHTIGQSDWQDLFDRVASIGWQIEMQADAADLPYLFDTLWSSGANLVVDHFGRPDPTMGADDPGFRALLERAESGRVWVKLSAPYRLGGAGVGPYANALMKHFGPERLLWGSDWPWLQFEEGKEYGSLLGLLSQWVPDRDLRHRILGATPLSLFGFDKF